MYYRNTKRQKIADSDSIKTIVATSHMKFKHCKSKSANVLNYLNDEKSI